MSVAQTLLREQILGALADLGQPVWPLDLAQALRRPYGTVYGSLRALYDEGLVVGVTEQKRQGAGRPARVRYRLTEAGREQAAELPRST